MKVKRNRYDTLADAGCLICLFGVLVYLAVAWKYIPAQIPGHYNALGQIDRMTGKGSLIVLSLVAWSLYIGISTLERFPQIWNTGVTVTEENRQRVYRTLKDMIVTVKLIMTAFFSYLTLHSTVGQPLPVWLLPAFLALAFGPMVFFLIKLYKIK